MPYGQRWTSIVAEKLGAGYRIIPEGLNGRTTVFEDPVEAGRNGLDYLHPCLVTHHPVDAVVFMLGTNDTKHRFGLFAVDIALGMKRLVKTVLAGGYGPEGKPPKIGIIAPPVVNEWIMDGPFLGSHEISIKLAREYQLVAREFGCAFLDTGEHIFCSMPDGIHIDSPSHALLGAMVAEWIGRELFPG